MDVLKAASTAALSSGSRDHSVGSGWFSLFPSPTHAAALPAAAFPSISIYRNEKECQQNLRTISVGTVEYLPVRAGSSWSPLHAPLHR